MQPKVLSYFATIFVLVALLTLSPGGSGAAAAGPGPAAGGTVPYSGQLNDDAGQPVADGTYAFTFALYDAPKDGRRLWSETQAGVVVKGGAFTAMLGSAASLPSQARIHSGWLVVSVRGPGEPDFTALAPRQALDTASAASPSSPAAGTACAHTHFGEAWKGDSTGTPAGAGFKVEDTLVNGNAIAGIANAGSSAYGVYGESLTGYGARGYSPFGTGVAGLSTEGTGVFGYSENVRGVAGSSASGFAMAALGNTYQKRDNGGWVKAMARISGTSITRCFNSFVSDSAQVSVPPCGISSTDTAGVYVVTFAFQVNDRFISVTPEWASTGVPSGVVDSFPAPNQVKIKISSDSAFFIIVY